jgi:hypothetical protein
MGIGWDEKVGEAMAFGILGVSDDPGLLSRLRERWRAQPNKLSAPRSLARAIANACDESNTFEENDVLLGELRSLREAFPHDACVADMLGMSLANSAREATSGGIIERNSAFLSELQTLRLEGACYRLFVMGTQYLGLLRQKCYEEAEVQLSEMAVIAATGTNREQLEWLIAIRHGFWIFQEQGELSKADDAIERIRGFTREFSERDNEAPGALLAMLLGSFEAAERRGDFNTADARFEEACLLARTARDDYGHVSRLHAMLSSGQLGTKDRAGDFAKRLERGWPREIVR